MPRGLTLTQWGMGDDNPVGGDDPVGPTGANNPTGDGDKTWNLVNMFSSVEAEGFVWEGRSIEKSFFASSCSFQKGKLDFCTKSGSKVSFFSVNLAFKPLLGIMGPRVSPSMASSLPQPPSLSPWTARAPRTTARTGTRPGTSPTRFRP